MMTDVRGKKTEGYAVTDASGNIVWVGNPEVTQDPTFKVYSGYPKARAALRRIHRATLDAGADCGPLRIAHVIVTVDNADPPIVPARRKRKGD